LDLDVFVIAAEKFSFQADGEVAAEETLVSFELVN
jgi:hypothetical protein